MFDGFADVDLWKASTDNWRAEARMHRPSAAHISWRSPFEFTARFLNELAKTRPVEIKHYVFSQYAEREGSDLCRRERPEI